MNAEKRNPEPRVGCCVPTEASPSPRKTVADLGLWEWWCSLWQPPTARREQPEPDCYGPGDCDRHTFQDGDAG